MALSGLAVAAMGGVNAASTGCVLVLPALFILIKASGRLRLSLLAKWAAAVLAGTAWWLIPLLLQGRYSFNFLPYIEQAQHHLPDDVGGRLPARRGQLDRLPEPRHPVAVGGLVGRHVARGDPGVGRRGGRGALRAGPPGHAGAALAAGLRGPGLARWRWPGTGGRLAAR